MFYRWKTRRGISVEDVQRITWWECFIIFFFPPPLLLQMQCKLYVFEKTAQSWIERGRGLLRLNDMASTDDGTLQSRLGKSTFKKLLERGKKKNPFCYECARLFLQFSHPNSFSGRKHLIVFTVILPGQVGATIISVNQNIPFVLITRVMTKPNNEHKRESVPTTWLCWLATAVVLW